MKKIIFLDIDGVLAIPETQYKLCSKKQYLLGKIISETGAKIVLSSSWRYETLERTKESMKESGFMFVDDLIGVTVRAYHFLQKGTKIHLSIPRGVEIKQWIDTNIHSEQGKDFNRKTLGEEYNYVILDDDNDMLLEHQNNFINTDGAEGLTEQDAKRAIGILNGEPKTSFNIDKIFEVANYLAITNHPHQAVSLHAIYNSYNNPNPVYRGNYQ